MRGVKRAMRLGETPNQGDLFDIGPPKTKSATVLPAPQPVVEPRRDASIRVLSLGEAAARLGVTRLELERLIAAGKIEASLAG
jgi:hypothetical protein